MVANQRISKEWRKISACFPPSHQQRFLKLQFTVLRCIWNPKTSVKFCKFVFSQGKIPNLFSDFQKAYNNYFYTKYRCIFYLDKVRYNHKITVTPLYFVLKIGNIKNYFLKNAVLFSLEFLFTQSGLSPIYFRTLTT